MPEINRRQALVLDGAVVLDNPNGTAPGQWIEHESGRGGAAARAAARARADSRALVDGPLAAGAGEHPAAQAHDLRHRHDRVARRRSAAAVLRALAAVAAADRGDHSRGAGQIELHLVVRGPAEEGDAAPRAGRGRCRAGARRARLQHVGRASRGGRGRAAHGARLAHRAGRVVHGRSHVLAAHRRAGQLGVRRARRGRATATPPRRRSPACRPSSLRNTAR